MLLQISSSVATFVLAPQPTAADLLPPAPGKSHRWGLCPEEAFGWGSLRGMHTDRGSPNLTLRLRLEDRLKIRLVQTWEVRHRGHLIQYTEESEKSAWPRERVPEAVCLWMPCLALPCLALPCLALPCLALFCLAPSFSGAHHPKMQPGSQTVGKLGKTLGKP